MAIELPSLRSEEIPVAIKEVLAGLESSPACRLVLVLAATLSAHKRTSPLIVSCTGIFLSAVALSEGLGKAGSSIASDWPDFTREEAERVKWLFDRVIGSPDALERFTEVWSAYFKVSPDLQALRPVDISGARPSPTLIGAIQAATKRAFLAVHQCRRSGRNGACQRACEAPRRAHNAPEIQPGDLIEGVQTENLTWGNDARLDQLLSRQGIGEATPTAREVLRRAALIEEEEQDLGAMSSTRLLLALTSVGGAVQLVGKTTTTDDGRGVLALHRIFSSQDAIGTGFRAIASKFRTPFTKGLRRSVSITVNVKAILSDH